ncbi:hypothetical protein FZI93_01125, partial [Mycobacterium sp. CBMA361]|nr:hypothetical protein [Mycolicibacterium sp. CBMA 361]
VAADGSVDAPYREGRRTHRRHDHPAWRQPVSHPDRRTDLLPPTARSMRRIEKVAGRTDDMIILRGVNLFPTQIEELILQIPALSAHFQCVLSRAGTLDELAVRVERRADCTTEKAVASAALLKRLVKNSIGVTVAVDVAEPETIERSTGKMQRVIDNRPPR